jgi:2-polyprenyl-3-methyl-5-hydroxy-6-metoxy-1,4-benzoquinol methylase
VSTSDGIPAGKRPPGETGWDGEAYQRRFDALAASGVDIHGEADLVDRLAPRSVLDAGCGTGRVAGELARRGHDVVGIDRDASMIATARQLAPDVAFRVVDVAEAQLGRRFHLVLMAGNVPLFTPAGTQRALVAGCVRHLEPGGSLVAGFQLNRGYTLEAYDADCAAAGLELTNRWSTWDGDRFDPDGDYAVSVHRLPA